MMKRGVSKIGNFIIVFGSIVLLLGGVVLVSKGISVEKKRSAYRKEQSQKMKITTDDRGFLELIQVLAKIIRSTNE